MKYLRHVLYNHKDKNWYIYYRGKNDKIHFIDKEKTLKKLKKSYNTISYYKYEKGKFDYNFHDEEILKSYKKPLIIHTKKQSKIFYVFDIFSQYKEQKKIDKLRKQLKKEKGKKQQYIAELRQHILDDSGYRRDELLKFEKEILFEEKTDLYYTFKGGFYFFFRSSPVYKLFITNTSLKTLQDKINNTILKEFNVFHISVNSQVPKQVKKRKKMMIEFSGYVNKDIFDSALDFSRGTSHFLGDTDIPDESFAKDIPFEIYIKGVS